MKLAECERSHFLGFPSGEERKGYAGNKERCECYMISGSHELFSAPYISDFTRACAIIMVSL